MRSFAKLFAGLRTATTPKRTRRPARLAVEALEERALMSATPTDMTALVKQLQASGKLARPSGPTMLYLNFDGYTNNPYSGEIGSTAVGKFAGTARDIQSILYKTAEIFAPFNVEVQQITGDGSYAKTGGATTVFVGEFGFKDEDGVTPGEFCDCPSPARGTDHLPNSDAFDIAFANGTVSHHAVSEDKAANIAAVIAHEAGHTFGLAHVRTDGKTDYPDNPFDGPLDVLGSRPPDVMSYDSLQDFFSNTAFNLTSANGNSSSTDGFPKYQDTLLRTQNSFTYLQAVLGARPATSHVGIADQGTEVLTPSSEAATVNVVDPAFYKAAGNAVKPLTIAAPSVVTGTLPRPGDYAIYRLDLLNSGWHDGDTLVVTPTSGAPVNLMILDETTDGFRATSAVVAAHDSAQLDYQTFPFPGQGTLYLVVGGAGAASADGGASASGSFTLSVGPLKVNLGNQDFEVTDAAKKVLGHVAFDSVSGGKVSGTFTPSNTAFPPMAVTGAVEGQVNGVSAFRFSGSTYQTVTINDPDVQVTKITSDTLVFTGTISQGLTKFTFTGQGSDTIVKTNRTVDPKTHKGTQTTSTTGFSFTGGSATRLDLPPTGPGTGNTGGNVNTTAALAAAPGGGGTTANDYVRALGALMALEGSGTKHSAGEADDPFAGPFAA